MLLTVLVVVPVVRLALTMVPLGGVPAAPAHCCLPLHEPDG